MSKKDLFELIKTVNKAMDEGNEEAAHGLLDVLIDVPIYKQYWFLHFSKRTNHYWVTLDRG